MKRGISSIEVKRLNRNRVFRYLNSRDKTSMPDMAADLQISAPTVLQMVKELKELGLITEIGEFESTGGRKPKALGVVQDACFAVGVDITRNHVSMVLTNLSRKVLKHVRIRKPFVKDKEYIQEVEELITNFCLEDDIVKDKISGIGFSIPGIVDSVNHQISYSHILDLRDINYKEYLDGVDLPYIVINDANAAAITEYIGNNYSENIVYLSLSNTVGGGIIFGNASNLTNEPVKGYDQIFRNMYLGNHWRSGEFGHMILHSDGPECYCGKKGCLDVYCSSLRLAALTDGNLERFFDEVERGSKPYEKLWDEYMDHLAIAVDNLHMSFDCDIVLGGYVGSCMDNWIQVFQNKVGVRNIFGRRGSYVRTCKHKVEASALGAALYQIEKYIDTV